MWVTINISQISPNRGRPVGMTPQAFATMMEVGAPRQASRRPRIAGVKYSTGFLSRGPPGRVSRGRAESRQAIGPTSRGGAGSAPSAACTDRPRHFREMMHNPFCAVSPRLSRKERQSASATRCSSAITIVKPGRSERLGVEAFSNAGRCGHFQSALSSATCRGHAQGQHHGRRNRGSRGIATDTHSVAFEDRAGYRLRGFGKHPRPWHRRSDVIGADPGSLIRARPCGTVTSKKERVEADGEPYRLEESRRCLS